MDDYDKAWSMADAGTQTATGTVPGPTDTGFMTGLMQQALSIGGNYLNRRLDIDLAGRLAGSQPMPYRYTNQSMVGMNAAGADLTTRGVAAVGGMRIGDMMPLLIGGLVLFMILGKGKA